MYVCVCTLFKLVLIVMNAMYYEIISLHLTHPVLEAVVADMQRPGSIWGLTMGFLSSPLRFLAGSGI